jgi:hypothetical protein
MQWPLTSQLHGSVSQREQLFFSLRIKLHALRLINIYEDRYGTFQIAGTKAHKLANCKCYFIGAMAKTGTRLVELGGRVGNICIFYLQ